MRNMGSTWAESITAPARNIKGSIRVNNKNGFLYKFLPEDNLISIKVERTQTNGKLFGYTISQKATIVIFDIDNNITIEKGNVLFVEIGVEDNLAEIGVYYTDEVIRDEVKKQITITGYDHIYYEAANKYQNELDITFPITLEQYLSKVANALGVSLVKEVTSIPYVAYTQETAPNFNGNETLRDVLTALAEATGSICFMDGDNCLRFKRLKNEPVLTISKNDYFEFKLGEQLTLTKLTHATELGDNYTIGTDEGFNQILRNNPFIENRTDIDSILNTLHARMEGLTQYDYSLKWRGNPGLEIGDCVSIDGKNIYYIGETINYTGGMSATSEWKTTKQENPEAAPTTIGQAITQTFAKVDKVNKQIELVVSDVSDHSTAISNLQIDANTIKGSVESVQKNLDNAIEGVDGDIETLTKKVEATMTAEDVQLKISEALSNGVSEVTTTTGFTFNKDGLTVSKTGSEMTTNIDEDGMSVFRDNVEVLTADNTGVKARNLHAETYLIIGNNSRFEDYVNTSGEARTGCFWIG